MENSNQRTETAPLALTESMATVLASIVGIAMVAALLEPEEIEKYTSGQIGIEELTAFLVARIPNGRESSTVRLIRAFGIRLPPALIDQCFQALEMDGVPIDSWLFDLESRITTLEETIGQPARQRDDEDA